MLRRKRWQHVWHCADRLLEDLGGRAKRRLEDGVAVQDVLWDLW